MFSLLIVSLLITVSGVSSGDNCILCHILNRHSRSLHGGRKLCRDLAMEQSTLNCCDYRRWRNQVSFFTTFLFQLRCSGRCWTIYRSSSSPHFPTHLFMQIPEVSLLDFLIRNHSERLINYVCKPTRLSRTLCWKRESSGRFWEETIGMRIMNCEIYVCVVELSFKVLSSCS